MRDSFDRFGDDLAELLMSSMKITIEDNFRLQLLSKQWQRLLFNTQTDIEFVINYQNYRQSLELFAAIVQKCPNIQSVIISDYYSVELNEKLLDQLVIHCRRLQHLSIHANSIGDNSSFYRLMATIGPKLKTLVMKGRKYNYEELVNNVSQYLPKLNKLVICDNKTHLMGLRYYFYESGVVCKLPASLQSVSFKLQNKSLLFFKRFIHNYGQQLRSLDIVVDLDTKTDMQSFVQTLTLMSELTKLRVKTKQFSDVFIDNLITNGFSGRRCLKLKSFDFISNFQPITDYLFNRLTDSLGKNLKQLKRLAIHCCVLTKFGENPKLSTDSLIPMKQLTHLSLKLGFINFSDQFFIDIVQHLPRLQSIDLINADITRRALQSLSRLCHLKTVRLAYCSTDIIADHLIIDDLISAQPMVTNVYISYLNNVYCENKFIRGNFI